MTLSLDQRDEARFQQRTAQQYREWVAWLEAKLELIRMHRESTNHAATFEETESNEQAIKKAQTVILATDPKQRELFEAVAEYERITVQSEMQRTKTVDFIDPDEVTQVVYEHLLADAKGETSEDGRGMMPRGSKSDIKWYAIDIGALSAAPGADAYAASQADKKQRNKMLFNIGGAVGALLFGGLMLFQFMRPKAEVHTFVPPSSNGQVMTAWKLAEARIIDNEDQSHAVNLAAYDKTTGWPRQGEQPSGFYRATNIRPIQICVPGIVLTGAKSIVIAGTGNAPERIYDLREAGSNDDLVVEYCPGTDKASTLGGTLRSTAPNPAREIGAGDTIPGTTTIITMTGVTAIGQGEDVSIPQGQTKVVVMVDAPATIDWPALAPALILPNGSENLPTENVSTESGVALAYLIATPAETTPIVWSVSGGETFANTRWRGHIDPPLTRSQVIMNQIKIDSVRAEMDDRRQSMNVTIVFRNTTNETVMLANNDISLMASGFPLDVPPFEESDRSVEPGKTRTRTITVPTTRGDVTLTIGRKRFVLSTR